MKDSNDNGKVMNIVYKNNLDVYYIKYNKKSLCQSTIFMNPKKKSPPLQSNNKLFNNQTKRHNIC